MNDPCAVTAEPLANHIRRLRLERGWSQERLARKAGVSHQTVMRAERADATYPHYSTRLALARALGVNPRDFDAEP